VELYLDVQPTNIRAGEVQRFLQRLLHHLRGPLVLLWDRAPIHKAKLITEFRASHPRVRMEQFPGYAPELNPDECLWTQLKRALCNAVPTDFVHLQRLLRAPVGRLRTSQRLLWSCILASDLPW
jgi:transposase